MTIDPLSLLGFGKDMINLINNTVRSKVVIVPSTLDFVSSEWNITKSIVIRNTTDNDIYDIQLVIWVGEKTPDLKLEIEAQDKGMEKSIGPVSLMTDCYIISGETNGKYFKLVQINSISPMSAKKVFITANENVKLKLKIIGFSKSPTNIAKRNDEIAIPFKPPFSMKLQSISMLLKRNGNDLN